MNSSRSFQCSVREEAMNAANLAREQLDVLEHYLAVALLYAV